MRFFMSTSVTFLSGLLFAGMAADNSQQRAVSPCSVELKEAQQEIASLRAQLAGRATSQSNELRAAIQALKALKGVSQNTTWPDVKNYFAQASAAAGQLEARDERDSIEPILRVYSEAIRQWERGLSDEMEHYDLRTARDNRYREIYPTYARCIVAVRRDFDKTPAFAEEMAPCLLREGIAQIEALRY